MNVDEVIAEYMADARELVELADTTTDRTLSAAARYFADIPARAAIAESDDPGPADRPWCDCQGCQQWLLKARWHRIAGGSTV